MAGSTLSSEAPEVEVPVFDIEEQLADHLVIEDSCREIYRNGITTDYLLATRDKKGFWKGPEKHGAAILEYVRKYMDEHKGVPPLPAELVADFSFQPNEPVVRVDFLIDRMRDRYFMGRMEEVITTNVRGLSALGVTDKFEERRTAARHFRNDIDGLLRDMSAGEIRGMNTADWEFHQAEYDRMLSEMGDGITFGCPQIDMKIGKLNGLTFIIGRPKQGKSWFLLWSAIGAQKEFKRPIFFSLEMPDWEMSARHRSLMTDVSYERMARGTMTDADRAQIAMEMAKFEDAGVPPMPIIHLGAGQRNVANLLEIAKQNDADIMYIDQYSFLSDDMLLDKNLPIHEAHSRLCFDLKNASLEIPIYIAAQFSREASKVEKPEEMANLEHIGLSDQIGQKADTLMGLWQTEEMRRAVPQYVQLRVLESRSRGTGAWWLYTEYSNACHIAYKEAAPTS